MLILSRPGGSLAGGFTDLVKDLVVIVLGLATYGALFAWVGARIKRPLLTGLAFVFAWEPAILLVMGGVVVTILLSIYLPIIQSISNISVRG